jgi:hypothetical protein
MDSMKKLMNTVDVWIPGERLVSMDKGHEFENYVINLFKLKKDYFTIAEWKTDHSDKRAGARTESYSKPNLVIRYKPENEVFAVKCTWRANPFYNQEIRDYVIKWAESSQIKNYQRYSRHMNMPVFIVVGLAGKPSHPEYTFCIPLEEAKSPELLSGVLDKYEREPPDKPFFWDTENKKLR